MCNLESYIEKAFKLSIKTKEFWHYVKTNKKSWDFHYQNERAFEKAFSTLSNVINSIAKTRSIYDEAFKKINVLWDSTKKMFTRNQFVQILRNLRRCALRDMTLKEACRDVVLVRILSFDPDHQDTRLNSIREGLASIFHKSLFCTIDFLLFFFKSIFLVISIS
jgi:hypothetical protein